MSSTNGCGISHVLPGDQWLAAVTPHQGRPCTTCSPLTAVHQIPDLPCFGAFQGWPAGTFALSHQHMLWWHQVTLLVTANAGFLAILEEEEREISALAPLRNRPCACR